MAEHKIGNFNFLTMSPPPPDVLHEEQELIARPGIDGIAVFQNGKQGRPFQVVTEADAQTFAAARALAQSYAAIEGTAVDLTWNGIDLRQVESLQFVVLRVTVVDTFAIKTFAGSQISSPDPATGYCVARWDLVPFNSPP